MLKSKDANHIQKKYDTLVAQFYNEERNSFHVQKEARKQIMERLKLITDQRPRPKKIIDLATGTGELIQMLKEQYPDSEIWGLDLSSKMIEKAQQINANLSNVYYVNDNALHVSHHFRREIDLVVIQFLLSYIDLDQILKQLNLVVQPKGLVAITNTTLHSFPELFQITKTYYEKYFFKKLSQEAIAKSTFVPQSEDEICEKLVQNGYKVLDRQKLPTPVVFKDYDEFYYFGTSRGWFLQAFDRIPKFLNIILKQITKKHFPLKTHIDASMIIAEKQ